MIGERNLAPERGPNVWDRDESTSTVAGTKRWLTGLGGAAIAVAGGALAVWGGSMVYRATRGAAEAGAGHVPASDLDALPRQASRLEDIVARESAQSFPASDPPSWTPTTGATANRH